MKENKKSISESKQMTGIVIHALDEKKAEDIRVIDISNVSVMADYFVIANGSNRNQIQAMVDNVEEKLHKGGFDIKQVEGYETANWVLMDCRDVIVHVFDKENRLFYDLERIWRDGKSVSLSDMLDDFVVDSE